MKLITVACLIQLLFTTEVQPQPKFKALSEIRYRFTSCNTSGLNGPSHTRCRSYYKDIGSPIYRDRLLNDSPEQQGYLGAQGFTFPRTGWYKVIVAGASGGRGLCNPEVGKGVVISGQIYIVKGVNDSAMAMVGQQGTGPCNVNPTHELCSLPLPNVSLSGPCFVNWTEKFTNFDAPEFYSGGGSGGGASMLWPPDREGLYVTNRTLPYIVSGGGGGSAVILNYEFIRTPMDPEEFYRFVINAKPFSSRIGTVSGKPGNLPFNVNIIVVPVAGGGGGYFFERIVHLAISGKPISNPKAFAIGGNDCAFFHNRVVAFNDVNGGFGGGGGACSEGGGGGGFSGGSVLAPRVDYPGEGGFSKWANEVVNMEQLPYNEGNGYIDIVPLDCGCVDDCLMDIENDTFMCTCNSTSESSIAPDGYDCFTETALDVTVMNSSVVRLSGITNTFVYVSILALPEAISLYSMTAMLTQESNAGECAIVWLGEDGTPVLSSERSLNTVNRMATISFDNNTPQLSSYNEFLSRGVMVTLGLLISTGRCQVNDDLISANISVMTPQAEANLSSINVTATADSVANAILNITKPSLPSNTLLAFILVPSAILILLVICLCCFAVLCAKCKSAQKKRTRKSAINNAFFNMSNSQSVHSSTSENGLRLNQAYYRYGSQKPLGSLHRFFSQNNNNSQENDYDELRFTSELQGSIQAPVVVNQGTWFLPKHGMIPPVVNFALFNKQRTEDEDWLYDRSNLVFLREIGEGEFGKVLLMRAKNIAGYQGSLPVAVKTLTSTVEKEVQMFLKEVELMKKCSHPNIVSLLGVDSYNHEAIAPLMILEYMPYGDLRSFLEIHRPNTEGNTLIGKEYQLRFARDIASALHFLECNKYVHRDVAARNCLVGVNLIVKLADFGMTKGVQDRDYYRVAGNAILPVRWMAPESISYGVFSSATDVWSFGVLLWEIATYGEQPLANKSSQKVIEMGLSGKIVHRMPVDACAELSFITKLCHKKAEDRPKFSKLLSLLPNSTADDTEQRPASASVLA